MSAEHRWRAIIVLTSAIGLVIVAGCGTSRENGSPPVVSTTPDRKLVFAHYFPPYPISIDNLPADRDYYATEYLTADGSGGANAAFGGLLRDRPLPRPPRADPDWQLLDLEDEVRQAISAGIDGFTLDLLTKEDSTQFIARVPALLAQAAHRVDPSFRIMLMPDMNGELGDLAPDALADQIAHLAALPSIHHLADGRLVVSPFLAERHPATWWAQFIADMRARHGVDVALVPLFADESDHSDYDSVSYGYSSWGGRTPAFNPTYGFPLQRIAEVHRRGKIWMQPVSVQDYRPGQHIYDEADNTENLRDTWQIANAGDCDWVQLITWNDYSEGTSFAPSTHHGPAFLDISAYYIRRFKTRADAPPASDQLYLTHRDELSAARPRYLSTSPMTLRPGSSPARDAVEALTLLTAPATVIVTIGAGSHTCAAPAGAGVCTVPITEGPNTTMQPDRMAVSAVVTRRGAAVVTARSPWLILREPPVQDPQYTATIGTGGA